MAEQNDGQPNGEHDEERDGEIRALLASLRVDGPVPDDVADRLDTALEEEQHRTRRTSTGARRRRPWLLAAAAAAVVVVGGGTLLGQVGGSLDAMKGSAGGQAESADDAGASSADSAAERLQAAGGLPRIRPDRFARDVARIATRTSPLSDAQALKRTPEREQSDTENRQRAGGTRSPAPAAAPCTPPARPGPRTRLVTVAYAGEPATLVLSRPRGAARTVAAVWSCDGGQVLRQVRLPRGTSSP